MSLKIAMIGTRGVPAAYGGFETAVEEIGARLVDSGHRVLVYGRNAERGREMKWHRGMRVYQLPAIRSKAGETLSHTAVSTWHAVNVAKPDVAFVFNAANAPFVPTLQRSSVPAAVHVDGIEWWRSKWGRLGRQYYRLAEESAVRNADALIADAQGIADYYSDEFGAETALIPYGAPILRNAGTDLLPQSIDPGKFHLVVARFEPENHVLEIVRGYAQSSARNPLVVVGSAPFSADYTQEIHAAAASDPRIQFLGGVWDQDLLDQYYANALTYLHGHSVGGTNPSLLRAMGTGTAVVAYDCVFNREVAGPQSRYFADPEQVGQAIVAAEHNSSATLAVGDQLQARAAAKYSWDAVAEQYGQLAHHLALGQTQRGRYSGRRNPQSSWRQGPSTSNADHAFAA